MPDAEESAEAGLQGDPGRVSSPLLDAPNRAIIEALQRDGRQPYGAIAEEVGLSEAAVRRRVQRLRESGIMQIVAVTDPLQLGFTRQAMIGINVEGDVRTVAEKLSAMPEVDYVVMCAGSFDLLAEIVCEDDERLLARPQRLGAVHPWRTRHRDLPVPEVGQADLHLGHTMSGPIPEWRNNEHHQSGKFQPERSGAAQPVDALQPHGHLRDRTKCR